MGKYVCLSVYICVCEGVGVLGRVQGTLPAHTALSPVTLRDSQKPLGPADGEDTEPGGQHLPRLLGCSMGFAVFL